MGCKKRPENAQNIIDNQQAPNICHIVDIDSLLTIYKKAVHEDNESLLVVLKSKEIVDLFCSLDMMGYGLGFDFGIYMGFLVNWEDEPGWDECVFISNYKIQDIKEDINHAQIQVAYTVLGNVTSDEKGMIFKKHNKPLNEIIVYNLIKTKTGWKIDKPIIKPHVNFQIVQEEIVKNKAMLNKSASAKYYEELNNNIGKWLLK